MLSLGKRVVFGCASLSQHRSRTSAGATGPAIIVWQIILQSFAMPVKPPLPLLSGQEPTSMALDPVGLNALLAPEPIDSVAHVIQVALTPVFMLSGVASLLTLFNTRLARVSDHVEEVARRLDDSAKSENTTEDTARLERHQKRLRQRVLSLDCAVMLGGVGGASTCGAALALFLGSLHNSQTVAWLIFLFGGALFCTVAALTAFLVDTLLAWHGLKRDGALPKTVPVVKATR